MIPGDTYNPDDEDCPEDSRWTVFEDYLEDDELEDSRYR
ncbi:hypothetical protein C121_36 [Stenotrophomonas phage C121]|nr:hypothetical protein PP752_gp36 [Stenotrophomonas phage C121]UKL14769.1 hypothetical protein C121_36 [Stenotrophomonas phage C121]